MTFQQPCDFGDLVVAVIIAGLGIMLMFKGVFIFGLLITSLGVYSIRNNIKSRGKVKGGKVYPPKPWPDPPKTIPHWKSREGWDR